jgi:hypothetical protein
MGGHTKGLLSFRPIFQSAAEVAELRALGLEPTQACGNRGERFIMAGDTKIADVMPIAERPRGTPYDAPDPERDANAQRLVSAWNACTGLSDAALSQDVIAVVREALGRIIKRSTPHIDDTDDDRRKDLYHIDEIARKALALLATEGKKP